MRRELKYTPEELKQMWIAAEAKAGKMPKQHKFPEFGLPEFSYYERAFGKYSNFLRSMGWDVSNFERRHRLKGNSKRFLYPSEYLKLLSVVHSDKQKFWIELLVHTGCRFDEARNIHLRDIDLKREMLFVAKPKGGTRKQRTIQISTFLKNRMFNYAKQNKLNTAMTFGLPPNSSFNTMLKRKCKKAGIKDWEDFSAHSLRRTCEMWLVALNINALAITAHLGHSLLVASDYYISTNLFPSEEKVLAKSILDNLLNK